MSKVWGHGLPAASSRPEVTRRTGNRSRSPGLGHELQTYVGTPRSAPFGRRGALCAPYDFSRPTDASKTVVHESILTRAGARRATAAAPRRTTSASSAAARASSVVTLDARRPRSGTPRLHLKREAPSGPRPASGSCARTASPPVDSSGPPCTDSGAAIARRGPATTAGRAAFSQPVAAAAAAFVEAAPAAGARRTTRPKT